MPLVNIPRLLCIWKKVEKAAPKNEGMLEELYNTYFQSKEYERALPVVKDLAKLNPAFSEDLVNLYVQNEKYDAALSLLDSLDKVKAHSTYRESLRRQIYARTNNVEAQIVTCRRILRKIRRRRRIIST